MLSIVGVQAVLLAGCVELFLWLTNGSTHATLHELFECGMRFLCVDAIVSGVLLSPVIGVTLLRPIRGFIRTSGRLFLPLVIGALDLGLNLFLISRLVK